MTRRLGATITASLGLLLAGCGSPAEEVEEAPLDLPAVITALEDVPTVTEIVPQGELEVDGLVPGSPVEGAYDGAVVYDSRRSCDVESIECGALVEVWPSPEAARARSEEILALALGLPALGVEYHYLNEGVLLRVLGGKGIPRRAAAAYESQLASL